MTTSSPFALPAYQELPTMGLYLNQVVTYLQDCCAPFGNVKVTQSMISNYVKHHLIDSPQNKLYQRDQIAQLLFIVIAKNVVEQKNLQRALQIQEETYPTAVAYDYFVKELDNALSYVFGYHKNLQQIGSEHTKQKRLLRNLILAFAYQAYLAHFFNN
ncbi:hypothetical protein FD27_GL001483 [Limosilactobacillus frumenti DSM 13145]|uniref:BS ykrK family protein n=1 Tax=Limosilactobacillus frumenti DSM 13145 TaxID=1423746 RepID=A0A0R1P8K8_9LACO|nr:DUF1836 domain-containing protein [Limosilactobacillus frumenti]KRL28703.1 hypothetical protein FD27_GL001483 [Limosilactobacillus frumenti DSM 13145]MBA2914717.1 DUF1836 domain-containing protein [Limosilactobacillus frumenti]QFG72047.1 DUF1836 domain-containing protein [Limosilactobacillus frumenti]